ncbi:hypothetical protein QQL38_25050 [Pseudomonas syringae]|mgnify:CR=1 FL=1|uniref:hypothetical protein n=1 Tax=Pseudomonas syringae TaxID=317 RepID=UPI0020C0EDC0|nr:hypothetical protein [Pseudomonas syringae]MCL6309713.1 hypothetical protein [Pseudomonas syringae]
MDLYVDEQWVKDASPAADCFFYLLGGAALLAGTSRQMCLDFCRQNRDLVTSCLPGSLMQIAQASDFILVLDLVTAHGGRRLYLPTRAQRFFTQTGLLVPEPTYMQWRSLADVNGQIDIPSIWGLFLALRRAAIRLALGRNWTPEALHATFGVSRRQLKAYRPWAEPTGLAVSRLHSQPR